MWVVHFGRGGWRVSQEHDLVHNASTLVQHPESSSCARSYASTIQSPHFRSDYGTRREKQFNAQGKRSLNAIDPLGTDKYTICKEPTGAKRLQWLRSHSGSHALTLGCQCSPIRDRKDSKYTQKASAAFSRPLKCHNKTGEIRQRRCGDRPS